MKILTVVVKIAVASPVPVVLRIRVGVMEENLRCGEDCSIR